MTLRIKIIFVVIGLLIGTFFTSQLRSTAPASSFPSDLITAKVELVKSFVDEQTVLRSKIVDLRNEIEQAQKKNEKTSERFNLEALNTLKEHLGLTSVKGTGLNIFLDDSPRITRESEESISQSIIQASDLRDSINVLRVARAEAIAINGQRVIAHSSISAAGGSVFINNVPLAPPFLITAIGDPESLSLHLKESPAVKKLLKRKKEHGIAFDIKIKSALNAPLYSGDFRANFMKPSL